MHDISDSHAMHVYIKSFAHQAPAAAAAAAAAATVAPGPPYARTAWDGQRLQRRHMRDRAHVLPRPSSCVFKDIEPLEPVVTPEVYYGGVDRASPLHARETASEWSQTSSIEGPLLTTEQSLSFRPFVSCAQRRGAPLTWKHFLSHDSSAFQSRSSCLSVSSYESSDCSSILSPEDRENFSGQAETPESEADSDSESEDPEADDEEKRTTFRSPQCTRAHGENLTQACASSTASCVGGLLHTDPQERPETPKASSHCRQPLTPVTASSSSWSFFRSAGSMKISASNRDIFR